VFVSPALGQIEKTIEPNKGNQKIDEHQRSRSDEPETEAQRMAIIAKICCQLL